MNGINVTAKIKIYEIDNSDVPISEDIVLEVFSHWNFGNRIVLSMNGRKICVYARDLISAIAKCSD